MAERTQILIKGIVQGVGFRPFIFGLAESLRLKGYVTNTGEGVFVDIEGDSIPEFIRRLRTEAPPLSRITEISTSPRSPGGFTDFTIRQSRDEGGLLPFTLVSPDVSVCDDCLKEMLDPRDRRYLYPFINCTNCGPRYTITRSVPYDRPNTTMDSFAMCPACLEEYRDPRNRRFHAQPNACPECGPHVEFRMPNAECGIGGGRAIQDTIKMLKRGGIVAVKGIGGFHIACDAGNDDAVQRLRKNKRKSNKPFAVMSPTVDYIRQYCSVSDEEETLLRSNRRPVVLLRKREGRHFADGVSPNNQYIGCMLPYTPLHYLLFRYPLDSTPAIEKPLFKALVMTSGNLSEEPIVHTNEDALQKLSAIVDGFLLHDRDIFMRVDDSVVRIADCGLPISDLKRSNEPTAGSDTADETQSAIRNPQFGMSFIRRSRGYAPDPIMLSDEGPEVLGCGADLKNTFTLTKGKFAITSQHIGDMENYETVRFFEESLANLKSVYRVNPVVIAHDLHPGYLSTQWALNFGMPIADCGLEGSKSEIRNPKSAMQKFAIQHHYAHIGSVMAEHGLKRKVIGVAFDGTGYGTDGNLWGGEFLVADVEGFERVGQFNYTPLPGGEAAIREPWKIAVSCIVGVGGDHTSALLEEIGFIDKYGKSMLDQVIRVSRSPDLSPLSSGAGRLFDAVAALIGVCDRNTFEGEAAMALESHVLDDVDDQYIIELKQENGYTTVDFKGTIRGLIRDMVSNVSRGLLSTKFHNTVVTAIRTVVRWIHERSGINDVALSGGTFQNQYLLKKTSALLEQDGMNVLVNQRVPCNDGGISLGQAYLVRERLKNRCGMSNGECRK